MVSRILKKPGHRLVKGTAATRAMVCAFVCLCCQMALSLPAVAATYEDARSFKAAEILTKEMISSDYHTVDETVANNGFFNHYLVTSPFGTFKAPSTTALQALVGELKAIAAMSEVETDDTAIESFKQSGEKTWAGLKRMFSEPEDTFEDAAAGVKGLFNRAKQTVGKRKTTEAEDSKLEQVIGFSKAKGKIATAYGVNVYSRNQVLQEELERLALADYLGGLGVGVATSFVPGVGGIVLTTSGTARLLNEAINTTPPSELWVRNKNKLLQMGVSEHTIELFLNNPVFSPALSTVMTEALSSLEGVKNRDLLITVSLQASSPEMARVITEIAVLTAGYHKNVAPIGGLVPLGRVTRAVGKDGSAIVVLPTDYLLWSSIVADAIGSLVNSKEKELWLLGGLSPVARSEIEALGWQINTDVRRTLLPGKK